MPGATPRTGTSLANPEGMAASPAATRAKAKLEEYRRKRNFATTPEPSGETAPDSGGRSFVVQKHDATRLHYDFRLEMEGVLRSWAVPKGPSLDPADKRLAMETEDHPVEYGGFEGVIPENEYGGGPVVLWDRGTWEPEGNPVQSYHAGRLKFRLHGEKLRGSWALVKTPVGSRRDAERKWLLFKLKDEEARPGVDIVAARPESVETGRTLEDVASGARPRKTAKPKGKATPEPARESKAPEKTGARTPVPDFVPPELATLTAHAPEGDEWLHEMKFDGYRILCRLEDERVRLLSRKRNDWTDRLPELARAVEGLPARRALVDGELAVVLPDGTTSFQALQNLMSGVPTGELAYFAFDLLHLDGEDLTPLPLEERKRRLKELLGRARTLPFRYSDHVVGSGPRFFGEACRKGLEGIICKRRGSPYRPGRGGDWLKVKCLREQEVVIGGYTPPQGSRVGLGALLVGVHDDKGRLQYAGKVGTGFTDATLEELTRRLKTLEQETRPFATAPEGASRARWVRPELVAQVAFGEWTGDGRMRHPSFRGLREDKPAAEVVREEPVKVEATETSGRKAGARAKTSPAAGRATRRADAAGPTVVAGVRLTHPDRVLYDPPGATKLDLATYYVSVQERILSHLEDRPLVLVRCPDGAHKECFFQKHAGRYVPDEVRRVTIQEAKKLGEYLVADDLPGLVGLVQMGVLELHGWGSRAARLEHPDRLVFDIDPDEGLPWERVAAAAVLLRERLTALDLASFLESTGGKGLHVVAPLQPEAGWDEVKGFAQALAFDVVRAEPRAYVAEASKARRKGKVFIDYLRNYRGASAIVPYSTRARAGAPVAMPLRWDELGKEPLGDAWTIENAGGRLAQADPWKEFWSSRQRLSASRLRSVRASSAR
jgi:bifunctional non-homologous end joining protein LigD